MKENFPNLVKEIDIQVRKAHRVANKMDTKRTTPRHIIIKMPKVKDKERILKAAKEKQIVTYKGIPKRLSADFLKETLQVKKGLARSIQSDEKQGSTTYISLHFTLHSLYFFLYFVTILNHFSEHPDYQCFELCI